MQITQVTLEVFKDAESGDSIPYGDLRFIRKPQTDADEALPIGKEMLAKIPRRLKSARPRSNFNDGWNIYHGTAPLGPGIGCSGGGEVEYGMWERDYRVGRFLFSISENTARQFIPNISENHVMTRRRRRKK